MNGLLLSFPEYRDPAQRLAERTGLDYAEADLHSFPDGETRVRIPPHLPARVVLCRSLDRPNTKLVELLLAAGAARAAGARHLTLLAPYLCYMRQDKAFRPGEAVSQRILGEWLAPWFDAVVTVDPHLHRVKHLHEAIPVDPAMALHATGCMGEFLRQLAERPVLLGPDAESAQWVGAIAAWDGLDYGVAHKHRLGDREVEIQLPEDLPVAHRHVVIVDDVASTGRTLEETARALGPGRPARVSVMVTHALLDADALGRLHAAGVADIWSSDSVPHVTNRFELAPLLADGLKALWADTA